MNPYQIQLPGGQAARIAGGDVTEWSLSVFLESYIPRVAAAALLLAASWRALDYLPYYGLAWSRAIAIVIFLVGVVSLPLALVLTVVTVGLALAYSSLGAAVWFLLLAFLLMAVFEDVLAVAVLIGTSPVLAMVSLGFLPIMLVGRLFSRLSIYRWVVCGLSVGAMVIPGILLGKEVFAGFLPTGLEASRPSEIEVKSAPESFTDLSWLREQAIDPEARGVRKLAPVAEQVVDSARPVVRVVSRTPLFLLLAVLWTAAGIVSKRGAVAVEWLGKRTPTARWMHPLVASLAGLALGMVTLLVGFGVMPSMLASSLPELPDVYVTAFWSLVAAVLIVLPINLYQWSLVRGDWSDLNVSSAEWSRRLRAMVSKVQSINDTDDE